MTIISVDPGTETAAVAVFVCRGDIEELWARSICDEQRREYELELDLAIEEELGRHPLMSGNIEVADAELVPIDWAES